ncbi:MULTISPECIES: LysR substrate-binding domain-containing protein [unclassified Vibrio]|uniref:LysR substrate-binding domain-containing protein n=1 Tax=unclassified Vibrio TaxID=2614977 RepID=UPI00265A0CAD|nr:MULTISPECIES: LysR substrate-binding domain-containing protein [unclassified Vibrio]EJE4203773.1 LysR family transcriptional regulator [Vibrio parahaemolyticus]MCR9981304.1 LysR substrate-binding domain-containing protein [Vibrio alginolyticus]MEA3484323.1 LysR substrate-binding domain-containing protein [Pseudomonadota bacterium]ELB2779874.1 LysR family transcriptional regulator [Vibrio parahaemolyticus]MDU9595511.1 LysR family transcriptional regulator [Vibrio sp. 2-1-2a]
MPLSKESLKTIHVIANSGSFAVAAERLNRVPSAISYTVKKLEEELGFALFDRTGRQVKLTPAGHYFIEQSRWMLDSFEELVRNSTMISRGVDVSFDIAINNIINRRGIVELVRDLNKQFPSTQIGIKVEVYNGCWDALYDRRADLIIGAPNSAPKLEGIVYHAIGQVEWDFIVGQTHPLASHIGTLTTEKLRGYPVVVVRDTSQHISPRVSWSLTGQTMIYAPELNTAIRMIEEGIGVGYVPHHLVKERLNQGKVLKKAIIEHKQPTQLFYAWHAQRESPVLEWCVDYLIKNEHHLSWHC